MPAKSDKEIVFFLTNVGRQPLDGDSDYVEKAKEVMKIITEKKIFLRPNDEIGIMLVGETDNDSKSNEGCTVLLQHNQVPSWETVEGILSIKKSNKVFNDWPTALSKVIEILEEFSSGSSVILILLFDCNATCPGIDSIEPTAIANTLVELNVQLLWIGSKSLMEKPPETLNDSEKVLMEIVNTANGKYMTMDKTLPSLRIFKRHKDRFMAWKCDLQFGDSVIPTLSYVHTTDDIKAPVLQTFSISITNNVETKIAVKATNDYVDRHRDAHSLEETIPGYMYGRKFIPVPEADEIGMNPEHEGDKSFEIFAAVSRDSVKLEDMGGEGSRIVFPNGEEEPFYCLAKAMVDTELVAIVRKVYQSRGEPKMCVLVPCIDVPDEPACLILIELHNAEDRRIVQSRRLNSTIKSLAEEKMNIVENLIDSVMLTGKDDKGDELFSTGKVPSPGLQHLWNTLSHRALNPDAPLPPIDENLKKLIVQPESQKIKLESLLKALKDLFPIEITKNVSTEPGDTSVQVPIPVTSKIGNTEDMVEKKIDESISHPEESYVDLDEIFDADMEM